MFEEKSKHVCRKNPNMFEEKSKHVCRKNPNIFVEKRIANLLNSLNSCVAIRSDLNSAINPMLTNIDKFK